MSKFVYFRKVYNPDLEPKLQSVLLFEIFKANHFKTRFAFIWTKNVKTFQVMEMTIKTKDISNHEKLLLKLEPIFNCFEFIDQEFINFDSKKLDEESLEELCLTNDISFIRVSFRGYEDYYTQKQPEIILKKFRPSFITKNHNFGNCEIFNPNQEEWKIDFSKSKLNPKDNITTTFVKDTTSLFYEMRKYVKNLAKTTLQGPRLQIYDEDSFFKIYYFGSIVNLNIDTQTKTIYPLIDY